VTKKIELPKVDFPIREFKVPSLSKTLFGTKTIQEDLKAENGRLKRELEVREKAIKDLKMAIEDEYVPRTDFDAQVRQRESYFNKYLLAKSALEVNESSYHKEHSLVIQLDGERENLREQLRQAREESVKYGKENEHLWGLLKIKMEG
jgi:hypothetical protein